jgi:predicted transcriptional regulator
MRKRIEQNEIDCVFRFVQYDKLSIEETSWILNIPKSKVNYIIYNLKPSQNYESQDN